MILVPFTTDLVRFNKDSSSLLIFCHFSGKYDYLLAGLMEKFGQFFWAPIAVKRY